MAQLAISEIKIDGGTQSRAALNEAVVAEYAEAIQAGASLPPVVVFFDGSAHWLADGFHRFHAHRKAASEAIEADVRAGTKRDAILHSVGANASHGLRRTNEDKRRAVLTLLRDAEWGKWSDNKVAQACGVSVPFVGAQRSPEVAERQKSNREASVARTVIGLQPGPAVADREPARIEPPLAPTLAPELPAKPAKGESCESLQAENAALREELQVARDNARELAALVESYDTASEGEHATAKELARLKAQLRTVEATRDQWMTTAGELRREVKALQRKVGRLAA